MWYVYAAFFPGPVEPELLPQSCAPELHVCPQDTAPRHMGWQFPCFTGMSLVWGTGCCRRHNSVVSHPSLAVEGLCLMQENLLPGGDLLQNKCSCPSLGTGKCGWSVCSVHWWITGGSKDSDFMLAVAGFGLTGAFSFSLRPPASLHVAHRRLFGVVKKWCRSKGFLKEKKSLKL